LGLLVRLVFAHGSGLLPVRRVAETGTVFAFEHPAPSWRPHILLVPKHQIRSFRQIRPDQAVLFGHLMRLAFSLAARDALYGNGFAVLINGGAYQDVAQAHVHLAGLDAGLTYAPAEGGLERTLLASSGLAAFDHPQARRAAHLVIVPTERLAWRDLSGVAGERVGEALVGVGQRLVARSEVLTAGFTLLASVRAGGSEDAVCFHLVGGGKR
jgi:diadenosine tetraphosphate (Ap4A) HIT family hydrolase